MSARTSGRQHRPVNYNDKAGGAGSAPAWALQLNGDAGPSQQHKENNRPSGGAPAGRKSGGAKQAKAPAVAQKGRDAGLERLPIEDSKGSKAAGKGRGSQAAPAVPPAAAGKQVLPGVYVKAAAPMAAAKSGSGGKRAVDKQASKSAGTAPSATAKPGSGGKPAPVQQASKSAGAAPSAAAPPAAKLDGSGGKRKAAAEAPPAPQQRIGGTRPAAKSAPAATAGPDAKRQKGATAVEGQAPLARRQRDEALAAPAGLGADQDGTAAVVVPRDDAEELAAQYSANFQALQAEYEKLQGLYEDLKAAKIDEEVQQLLEQQNRYVSEHGQKAAALVEHYKKKAEQHAATAAQLGGDAMVDQCHKLQSDLMNCQQALLDKEVECLDKEKRATEMAARLAFLERYARVYDSCDKCVQTDDLPGEDASAQFPSIQSSGLEMLQAHALVPEGAGGGSVYRRPRAPAGPQLPDTSYTLPAGTPMAAAAAAATTGAAPGPAAGGPVSGSDMELTGNDASQEQQQQQEPILQRCNQAQQTEAHPVQLQAAPQGVQHAQQNPAGPGAGQQAPGQRRQSLQPVGGRVAHAAAARPAPRPASAESQVQLAAQRPQPAGARRASVVPAAAAPAAAAAVGANRRVSAPPAPVDRELHFNSGSTVEPLGGLAPVPEEVPLAAGSSPMPGGEAQQAQQQQQGQELPPFEFPVVQAPAGSELTAPVAVRGGAPTPASVPAPPRHLAITALTGLTATPLKGGIFQYTDPRYGFTFELGPAPPDSADLGSDEARVRYRPVELGTALPLLPLHFKEEISFGESQKQNFFQQMMHALNQKR